MCHQKCNEWDDAGQRWRLFATDTIVAAHTGLRDLYSGQRAVVRLGSISKRGDPYVRTLLIHGARSVMANAKAPSTWQTRIATRRPANVAAVAMANKMARTAWAILAHGQAYQKDYVSVKPAQLN